MRARAILLAAPLLFGCSSLEPFDCAEQLATLTSGESARSQTKISTKVVGTRGAVPGRYIVVLDSTATSSLGTTRAFDALTQGRALQNVQSMGSLGVFTATMDRATARARAREKRRKLLRQRKLRARKLRDTGGRATPPAPSASAELRGNAVSLKPKDFRCSTALSIPV